MATHYLKQFPHIKALVFDVDGVLTDGSVTIMPSGEMVRTLNVKDGYALKTAAAKGFKLGIITGGNNIQLKERLLNLGVHDVFLKSSHKMERLEEFCLMHDLKLEEVLYMGDDLPDYEVMQHVGIATCPQDAAHEIREICSYISPFEGGKGCVRDIIEKVLRTQDKWFNEDGDFSW
ncbi:MAG: 3-deoxy-D-manno-octulosonate 8-phosphate phosphatase [Crocinitomicaceae bacterium]|nr:3-deoxy-D-manno-octulosonate 8-phosphate phosphatase [Crocinitomicaceae bacterium]|tara:strand:- start:1182 stop:1709 length:528 start_codon:yes stop_codon:yes gene_type:complete